MKKQLTLHMIGQHMAGVEGHPQEIMKNLGINYEHATPQSMDDCWWFWNCTNIPEDLPDFIVHCDRDPIDCIGWGLSESKAFELKESLSKQ